MALLPAALASVAGMAVIAMPLLWTWLFAEATTRPEISLGVATSGSLHPASLLTAFIGDLFGAKDPKVEFWGPYLNPNWVKDLALSQNMAQVYMGALPMLLLIAPGLTRGWLWDKAVRPLTLLFLFMVLYALGRYTPFFEATYDYLPGVKMFRRPADATFLIGALGAVLAGYVLHRMLTAENISFRRDLAIGGAVVLAIVLGAVLLSRNEGYLADAWKPVAIALGWFGAAVALLFVLQRWRGALGPVAARSVAILSATAKKVGTISGLSWATAIMRPPLSISAGQLEVTKGV